MTEWTSAQYPRDALPGRCRNRIEFVRQAPEGATGFDAIGMTGMRPCGGRLIDGKCEFCDIVTIADR